MTQRVHRRVKRGTIGTGSVSTSDAKRNVSVDISDKVRHNADYEDRKGTSHENHPRRD